MDTFFSFRPIIYHIVVVFYDAAFLYEDKSIFYTDKQMKMVEKVGGKCTILI